MLNFRVQYFYIHTTLRWYRLKPPPSLHSFSEQQGQFPNVTRYFFILYSIFQYMYCIVLSERDEIDEGAVVWGECLIKSCAAGWGGKAHVAFPLLGSCHGRYDDTRVLKTCLWWKCSGPITTVTYLLSLTVVHIQPKKWRVPVYVSPGSENLVLRRERQISR